ncbi:MAG: 2OG-Fe(II) oxygenase [Proteobacteria bacterium]|nr:2OG-Fe(II) oxygenase [Pseudomonadota bacterium]MCP4919986.1 2OG-Fe(II) oxygenase [Pseudomonadota bacterium]
MPLRPELLLRDVPEGVEVLDPLTDQRIVVSASDLEADRLPPTFLEGVLAEHLRAQAWAWRTQPPGRSLDAVEGPWSRAIELPTAIAPAWREPERWRRLAESVAGGAWKLELAGFTDWTPSPSVFERLDTDLVSAWRARGGATLFEEPVVRELFGAVLGLDLTGAVEANRWRMDPGDSIRSHRVGRRYAATFSLGLCVAWRAADGGAIAFGDPVDGRVDSRWLPHAGDLLVFAGGPHTWHWVEPPIRVRDTFTGWWTF